MLYWSGRVRLHSSTRRQIILVALLVFGSVGLYQLSLVVQSGSLQARLGTLEPRGVTCASLGLLEKTAENGIDERRISVRVRALSARGSSEKPPPHFTVQDDHPFTPALHQVEGVNAIFHSSLSRHLSNSTLFRDSSLETAEDATSIPSEYVLEDASATDCVAPETHVVENLPGASLNKFHTPILFFSLCTAPSRAIKMASTWSHFLGTPPHSTGSSSFSRDLPGCLVVDSEGTDDVDGILAANEVLSLAGTACVMKDSTRSLKMKDKYEARVFGLIREAWNEAELKREQGGPLVEWFIISDDDTWWADINYVKAHLSNLNPWQDHILGSYSDSVENLSYFGRFAYGGAGIIISRGLMEKMQPILPKCVKRFRNLIGGDVMISNCAAVAKKVDLKVLVEELDGLSQMDMKDDASGFMNFGGPFLTLHHWGSWLEMIPGRPQLEVIDLFRQGVEAIGLSNMFRRFIFDEGAITWTSGFSVVVHRKPLSAGDLRKVEFTWTLTTPRKPYRPALEEGTDKLSYYLSSVDRVSPTKTVFLHTCSHPSLDEKGVREISILWDTTPQNPPIRTWL